MEDINQKYNLITRNVQEILGARDLKKLVSERPVKIYWGTAPTGRIHIAYFVPILKIIDLLEAGCEVKVLLADIHAFLDNNKSELDIVGNRALYYELMVTEMVNSLYSGTNTIKFIKGSQYQFQKKYILDVFKLNSLVSVNEAKHSGAEVVKYSNNPALTGLLYPSLQALDEEYLDVDGELGGIDQRKLFVFSRKYLPKLGYRKRFHILTPMVSGLSKFNGNCINIILECTVEHEGSIVGVKGSFDGWKKLHTMQRVKGSNKYTCSLPLVPGQYQFKFVVIHNNRTKWFINSDYGTSMDERGNVNNYVNVKKKVQENVKMSASDSSSKIDMLDSKRQIRKKINQTYCLPGKTDNNSLLEICQRIIFPILKIKEIDFVIGRKEKFGGKIVYKSFNRLFSDYKENKLHPGDLKLGTIDNLDLILKPIRDRFKENEFDEVVRCAYN